MYEEKKCYSFFHTMQRQLFLTSKKGAEKLFALSPQKCQRQRGFSLKHYQHWWMMHCSKSLLSVVAAQRERVGKTERERKENPIWRKQKREKENQEELNILR